MITLSLKCMLRGEGWGVQHTFYRCPFFLLGNFSIQFSKGGGVFLNDMGGGGSCIHYFDPPTAYNKDISLYKGPLIIH